MTLKYISKIINRVRELISIYYRILYSRVNLTYKSIFFFENNVYQNNGLSSSSSNSRVPFIIRNF